LAVPGFELEGFQFGKGSSDEEVDVADGVAL
jgi:hypothetical protein